MAHRIRYRKHLYTRAQLARKVGKLKAKKAFARKGKMYRKFARGSLRAIYRGGKKFLIGCPKGKWSARRKKCRVGTRKAENRRRRRNPGIVDTIRAGDKVTISTRHGQKQTGRAVMRGPHGWVLNLGGAHGTPGIADNSNIVKVHKGKRLVYARI